MMYSTLEMTQVTNGCESQGYGEFISNRTLNLKVKK